MSCFPHAPEINRKIIIQIQSRRFPKDVLPEPGSYADAVNTSSSLHGGLFLFFPPYIVITCHYVNTLFFWGIQNLCNARSFGPRPRVSSSYSGACTYTPSSRNDLLWAQLLPARLAANAANAAVAASQMQGVRDRLEGRERESNEASPFFLSFRPPAPGISRLLSRCCCSWTPR